MQSQGAEIARVAQNGSFIKQITGSNAPMLLSVILPLVPATLEEDDLQVL